LLAGDARFATHQLGQALGDGQPEAGAAVFARGRRVDLLECLEEAGATLFRDADAGILDFETHQQLVALALQELCAQGNAAVLGELDRIAGEVEQGLAQPGGIAAQHGRYVAVVDANRQTLGRGVFDDQ
jgi:hypothetical protein